MNVRYYSVAKDMYEAGDCPHCARCGATMRHVTEVNGSQYGSGCGKIVIAELESIPTKLGRMLTPTQYDAFMNIRTLAEVQNLYQLRRADATNPKLVVALELVLTYRSK